MRSVRLTKEGALKEATRGLLPECDRKIRRLSCRIFHSSMTVSAAKLLSLFTTGSHLRDKSLNVTFSKGEVEQQCHTKVVGASPATEEGESCEADIKFLIRPWFAWINDSCTAGYDQYTSMVLSQWDESRAIFMPKQVQQLLRRGGANGGWWWCGLRFERVLCCILMEFLPLVALRCFCSCLLRAGVMRLPREFLAPEAQSRQIIIVAIHQRRGCNFEQMRGKRKNLKITDWGKKVEVENSLFPVGPQLFEYTFFLPLHVFVMFASLLTVSVHNTSAVWLQKPQFSVNLLGKDHAKHSAPSPINDAALGSTVASDYREARFGSQDKVCKTVLHITIDN